MALIYKDHPGHIGNLIPSLRRALGQYTRYCKHFKIGLTTNPEQRWGTYKRDGWDDMIVVYSTSSEKYVADAEKLLIKHGWEADYMAECWNEVPGGGGKHSGYEWYCVYIVVEY
jgi:hypothetical protein